MENHTTSRKRAAIVLGGGMDEVKRQNQLAYEPTEQVKLRLQTAHDFFQKKEVDYIVLTGRYSKRVGINPHVCGPKTEAEVGKIYLEEQLGMIETEHILDENQSFNTIGNAWFAKKICLEPFNITVCKVITSDYHIRRSEMLFKWVLGPKYTVECVSLKSELTHEEKIQRERIEHSFIEYMSTYLLGSIPPGDNKQIGHFIEHEHPRYCLPSERSEALLKVLVKTAAIKAGYV